jgi:hypothetical protein
MENLGPKFNKTTEKEREKIEKVELLVLIAIYNRLGKRET